MDDGNSIALLGGSLKASIHWPDRILGPRPGLKEVNLACWGMFVAFLIVPVSIVFWLHSQTGSGSIRKLHADFVYFYGVGQIAHQYSAVRVYDFELQQKTFNQIYPLHDHTYGPSPYPPFVALFFSLFVRMSFETAYLLWAVISLALYTVGIAATANEVFPADRLKTSLIFCFALAFYPFSFDTLMNGQLAAVAVCAVGLAISQERHSRPFCSGLALSMLAYKPTLLLLIIPMLLLTRRFKSLFGFIDRHGCSDAGGHGVGGGTHLAHILALLMRLWARRWTRWPVGTPSLAIYRLQITLVCGSGRSLRGCIGGTDLPWSYDRDMACSAVVQVGCGRKT